MELSTDSKRSARMLLAAWDSGDLSKIQNAADHADEVCPATDMEAERIDMVRQAGAVLRQHGAKEDVCEEGCRDAELDASLRLLRHLAGATVREAVPLGMHACVRR
jgi:hypothetical protein